MCVACVCLFKKTSGDQRNRCICVSVKPETRGEMKQRPGDVRKTSSSPSSSFISIFLTRRQEGTGVSSALFSPLFLPTLHFITNLECRDEILRRSCLRFLHCFPSLFNFCPDELQLVGEGLKHEDDENIRNANMRPPWESVVSHEPVNF